MRNGPKTEKMG
ncbi:hypothetical protein F383_23934 [Gossypium arboreum]|nr:hypothetical protein F383_23934 [Gossypium arboreum]